MAHPSHRLRADDIPTLRLVTLRRLVKARPALIVVDQATNVEEIEVALQGSPEAVVVLVDGAGVLQGTLRLGDLRGVNADASAAQVMVRSAPVMAAELDIEAARSELRATATDRILVIGTEGELLGILTDRDLRISPSRSNAA